MKNASSTGSLIVVALACMMGFVIASGCPSNGSGEKENPQPGQPAAGDKDQQPGEPSTPATPSGTPADNTSGFEMPATETPASETPADATSGFEMPATETPGDPAPGTPGTVSDPPVDDIPAPGSTGSDPPAGETPPVEEKPVVPISTPGEGAPSVPAGDGQDPAAVSSAATEGMTKYAPLFVNWPEPAGVLFLTGDQHGYFEPCGCTGLKNQVGGFARRDTLLKQLRDKGWKVAPIDAGNQIKRFGKQPGIKFETTVDGFKQMGYQAIGYGPEDLKLPVEKLLSVAMGDPEFQIPFVCANANVMGMTPAMQVFQAGTKKIGVTCVLGSEELKKVINSEVQKISPDEALKKVSADLQRQKCDHYVLLAEASLDESRRLAKAFPLFDIIVTTGGAGEPRHIPEIIKETGASLIEAGKKGMYVGVVGLYDDKQKPLRYQRVPLDARFKDSPEMLQLLADYQQKLETLGFEGLELAKPPSPSGLKFVGSEACGDCHTEAYAIWEKTPHAHALATLVKPPERYTVPRHHDPECISCHVIGWNPQGYHPYRSGFKSGKETPKLANVGCENCHGPGEKHVAAENGDIDATDKQLKEYQLQMRLPLKDARKNCLQCHDLDNSINFHKPGAFEKYWKKVEHKGMD